MKKTGYRLHIEATTTEPIAYKTLSEVYAAQKVIAKKAGRAIKEIKEMSYVLTEKEYQAWKAEKDAANQ